MDQGIQHLLDQARIGFSPIAIGEAGNSTHITVTFFAFLHELTIESPSLKQIQDYTHTAHSVERMRRSPLSDR